MIHYFSDLDKVAAPIRAPKRRIEATSKGIRKLVNIIWDRFAKQRHRFIKKIASK